MSIKKDVIKFTARKEQESALNYIKKICEEKPDNKFFLLNLPTGVGKSFLSVMISDFFTTKNKGSKVDIITAGKLLQNQYTDSFEHINSLKGKENYNCAQYSCSCMSGKEFNKLNKSKCDICPYDIARNEYIGGQVALTNFHLYLINAIYGSNNDNKNTIYGRESTTLIVDEADKLDQVMSDFISIKVTETIIKKFGFDTEDEIIKQLKNVSNTECYIDFLKYLSNEISELMLVIDNDLSTPRENNINSNKIDIRHQKVNKILDKKSEETESMQLITDLKQLFSKIEVFLKEYEENPNNWVLENYYNEKTRHNELSLEPIWAGDYLKKYVWSRYDYIICMSGTILNKEIFSEINGIDVEKSVYYSISSPFLEENRKIFYMPIGKMSYTKKEETFKKFIPIIHRILKKYEGKKGIIHSNSFELSKWIQENVDNKRLIFHDSSNKEEMLEKHFESKEPSVLVSPSVSTGVSFDHDLSRFQIIAKIPYPSLGSIKNKLRQKMNPNWYSLKTIGSLMQATGRSVRSGTDYADTIIIDESFGDVLRYYSHYFPKWFLDSIRTIDVK